jgi:hypothetical protein
MALTLVIFVVLGVVVLATAMLYSNTQRALSSDRGAQGRRAMFLAESGVARAAWRLSQSDISSAWYWQGATGQRLGGSEDTYDVRVTCTDGRYRIEGSGCVLSGDGQVVGRQRVVAEVAARSEWDGGKAVFSESMSVIPSAATVVGDVYAQGMVMNTGAVIGNVTSLSSILSAGSISGLREQQSLTQIPGPDVQSQYYDAYTLDGVTYAAAHFYAQNLNSNDPLCDGGAITDTNIKGVVFGDWSDPLTRRGCLKIGQNVNFQGTLVVQGDLLIAGDNVTLRAEPGFPAVIVTGDLILRDNNKSCTIDGAVVVGGWLRADSHLNAILVINGALIFKGSGLFSPFLTQGTVQVNYDSAKGRIRELANRTPGPADGPLHWEPREDWTFWDDED